MPWPERFAPTSMARVAIVAPRPRLRRVLVEVGDLGRFEPDPPDEAPSTPDAGDDHTVHGTATVLAAGPPDLEDGRFADRHDLDRGEAQLAAVTATAVRTERCATLTGWVPREDVAELRGRIEPHGGGVVELPPPAGVTPPTAHADDRTTRALRPLVTTYATVPYRDLDPTWFAAVAYVVMFGMMFGDVGHGALLAAGGLALGRVSRFGERGLDRIAPFLVAAGVSASAFGLLYGEAFGPTGLVPTLWLRPLDEPETLLLAGLLVGSVLMALTFALAAVDRWREGGAALAVYASSGIAGSMLFAGAVAVVVGASSSHPALTWVGVAVAASGATLVFIGLVVASGPGSAGVAQAVVEMFDTVLRLASNVVSFTRLAAFGLTHAVITGVVWDGTTALWDRSGIVAVAAAVVLFVVGNAAAFLLGALVGAVQALRLEYYELFSRLFATEGRPFRPWHPTVDRTETT